MNNKHVPTGKGAWHVPTRSELKARIALQGASGSGKTYSALLLAQALCSDFSYVAVIETSYPAIDHYRYFSPFSIIPIQAPYHPEKFLDALEQCVTTGKEVIIIDSLSSEWVSSRGIRDKMKAGEDCMHYHEALIEAIQQSPAHIIATLQVEEVYELLTAGGKREVEKLGLAPLQEPGIHYHFDTVLALDSQHKAKCLKDRTSFFEEHGNTVITEALASLFPKWLSSQAHTSFLSLERTSV